MDESFDSFFRERIKDRGISLKKLSELTGIASAHLENMVRGNFDDIPSAPYFHGYLIRLGKVLDFDGEVWWEKIKKEGIVKNSGAQDAMPRNRFVKESHATVIGIGAVVLIIIIYLLIQLPRIFEKPTLVLLSPDQNPYTAQSNTITIQGTVENADSLSLSGDEVTIAPDGSWQKGVLLQDGVNTFDISAKKFLGGQTDIVEEIIYQPSTGTSTQATSTGATATSSGQ